MKGKGRRAHAEYRDMFKRDWPIFLAGVARFVASGGPNGRMNELSAVSGTHVWKQKTCELTVTIADKSIP